MVTSIDTLDIKGKWELEANTIIADDEWESSWMSWHKCLGNSTWREFSWKLRMRYFKTPIVIAKYDKKYSPLCWRGCGLIGDFSHIFWDCPKLQKLWEEVKREIREILNLRQFNWPTTADFGNYTFKGAREKRLVYDQSYDVNCPQNDHSKLAQAPPTYRGLRGSRLWIVWKV